MAIWLPWHVLIHLRTHGQFNREIFLHHNFARAGLMEYGREFEATTGPAFYLGRLLADMFPWWIMLPGAIVQVFRPQCRGTWRQGTWLLVWMITWLVFFSCLHFRKDEYILPMYPAAVLLIGKMLADYIRSPAGGPIRWRTVVDATRAGLAWMFGRPSRVADPQERVEGDLRLTIALRIAFLAMAIATVLVGVAGLLVMRQDVREFLFTYPNASDPWIGTNEHDRTAFNVLAAFMSEHLAGSIALLVGMVAGMGMAAVLIFKRRPASAVALWTVTMASVMLAVVHVFQDRVLDRFRSQRDLVRRLEQVVAETGPDTRFILFGAEEHELVYLMPDRFDAVPRLRFGLLHGRLAALRDHPVLVLMPRRDYESRALFGPSAWGPLRHVLREIPTNLPHYDQGHNDAMVILLAPRDRTADGRGSGPPDRSAVEGRCG